MQGNSRKTSASLCVCLCSVGHSCLTLWDPMDCSPPGFSAHGIIPAKIVEWVAISSYRRSSLPRNWTLISCISSVSRWILHQLSHVGKASLVARMVKNLRAMQKTWVWSLGWEEPLEKGMATHSRILACRIPWTEAWWALWGCRVRHD